MSVTWGVTSIGYWRQSNAFSSGREAETPERNPSWEAVDGT